MKTKNKLLTHAFFPFIEYCSVMLRAHYRPLLFLTEVERSHFSLATVIDKNESIKTLFLNEQQLRESRIWLK